MLAWYDWLVLFLSCRFAWRCPSSVILDLYNRHITGNHLEVGVGTGYFLDRCRFPVPQPRLVLGDLNANCLAEAARRIARYSPRTIEANVLEPPALPEQRFDSIGLNFVLHCVPGSFPEKACAFAHLASVLGPQGVLFGSTILAEGVSHTLISRRLMAQYNQMRIFSNRRDSLDGLRAGLLSVFDDVEISTRGSVALFVARRPKSR
ncbi:MAG: class I SAM-dependent methyltransferase [Planctomycetaceae bacterium]|nr:MAG: class I SAM-dependent methyltransferase [Planctomycetaceae bacterium]